MNHGDMPLKTAQGLKVLRERIERAQIPPSKLDETLNIATWNIREFGRRKRRAPSLHFIAEIIGQFDIVCVIELRDNLAELKRVLEILGPTWRAVFSDFDTDPAGNRERIAYVYDTRAATFTGLAAEASPPRKKTKVSDDPPAFEYLSKISWWRSPYIASFQAGNFDFVLIAAHIRWSDGSESRVPELQMLADWIDKRRKEQFVEDKDIILVGDFNIPSTTDATYKAITSKGLRLPKALLKPDEGFGSNLEKNKRYDQILHYPVYGELFSNKGGLLDFYEGSHAPLYPGESMKKLEFTYELSDHLPLWIQIKTDDDSFILDQILSRKRR